MDLVGVVLLAPLVVPVVLIVALLIKCVSRGPAFFVQSRLGHGGEYFRIYKFRTMHVTGTSRDASHREYVASHAGSNAPVTKPDYKDSLIFGGSLMRLTSIDELPQLLNILIGNMSLVGPRPDVLLREDYEAWQLRRFEVLPGMTGLWQISGKNRLTFDRMIELDIEYIDNQSLALDLKIMLKTFKVILSEPNE